jgi:endonuclease/exonuclease/phosphatase family metal-dependent hydrolase
MRTLSALALLGLLASPGCAADAEEAAEASTTGALRESITFFTYNICGADSKCQVADPTKAVIDNVIKYHPTAFALQEVCQGQADTISRELRARNIPYVQRFQNAASHAWNVGCGGLQGWGNALFHIGGHLGEVDERSYESQGNYFTRAQNRGYVCVRVPKPEFWACSTHIDTAADQQKPQIDELSAVAEGLARRGGKRVPVIVGGDFNIEPSSERIDSMFAPEYARGKGGFLERDIQASRTNDPAGATHGRDKIDYVFYSQDLEATGGAVVPATSDHRLLWSSFLLP